MSDLTTAHISKKPQVSPLRDYLLFIIFLFVALSSLLYLLSTHTHNLFSSVDVFSSVSHAISSLLSSPSPSPSSSSSAQTASLSSSVSAGLIAGALHALTGPDHIAALLPLALHKRAPQSAAYGAVWGFGHGLSSVCVGAVCVWLRESVFAERLAWVTQHRWVSELCAACTVCVIGAMGLWETRSDISTESAEDEGVVDVEAFSECVSECVSETVSEGEKRTSLFTSSSLSFSLSPSLLLSLSVLLHGVCLGVSLDGLPSLTPALVLSDSLAAAFLAAYFASTLLSACLFTAGLSVCAVWITQRWSTSLSDAHTLSNLVARRTSFAALSLGALWLVLAVWKCIVSVPVVWPWQESAEMELEHDNDNVLAEVSLVSSSALRRLSFVLFAISITVSLVLCSPLAAPHFGNFSTAGWWCRREKSAAEIL